MGFVYTPYFTILFSAKLSTMILSAKNSSKTPYIKVESSQSEQGDKVNLLLLSASMIFLINATVGLIVGFPKFYVIGNENCTCNREAVKEQLKGKQNLSISSCKWISKVFLINGAVADFIVWEYSTYSNYALAFKGFPQLQIAMISDIGVIKAFPIDGQPYETFPEFKPKKFDDFRMDTSLHL